MSRLIFVVGDTGTGKSRSLISMNPEKTFLINCVGKDIPIKGSSKIWNVEAGNYFETHNPDKIINIMDRVDQKATHINTIVIDDFQYVMSFEYLSNLDGDVWDVFRNIGGNVYRIVTKARTMRKDLNVIIMTHSESQVIEGFRKHKIKTVGKMTDEKITLEGLATVVLFTGVRPNPAEGKQDYFFITQNDGTTTAKSPEGMFDGNEVPNDLNAVVEAIQTYY